MSSVLTARLLGAARFGELGMVRSTMLLFGALAGSGLGMAATKYVAEYRSTDQQRTGRLIRTLLNLAFLIGGGTTAISLVLASPLARILLDCPALSGPLCVASCLIVLQTLSGVQLGILSGFEAFRRLARLSLLDGLLILLLVPGGAWAFGVSGAIAGTVLAGLVSLPLKHAAIRQQCELHEIHVPRSVGRKELSLLWQFALPSVLVSLSVQPFEWLARLQLVRQPDGYAQLGVFLAAYTWGQMVLLLPAQVTGTSMPMLANLFGEGDRRGLWQMLKMCSGLTLAAGLAACLPILLMSEVIMQAYGHQFREAIPALFVLAATYFVAGLSALFRSILAATGRMWSQMIHSLIWGATLIIVFQLLPRHGALGLALSYLCAFSMVVVTQGMSVLHLLQTIERRGPTSR